MRRATALLVLVTAALGMSSGAAAASSRPHRVDIASSDFAAFELAAGNGLTALVEVSGHRVTLQVGDRSRLNAYEVQGRVSGDTVRARFGKLGHLSVRFRPARALPVERVRCGAFAQLTRLGSFVGEIHFAGEGGYVHLDSSRARGEVIEPIRYDCADPPPTVKHSAHRDLDETWPGRQVERETESRSPTALLFANAGHRILVAEAVDTLKGRAAFFVGGQREHQGAMRIVRLGQVRAPATAFPFDLAAGTATLTPPAPFTGTATVQRAPDGTKTLSGTLGVQLLGADPVPLTGPSFKVFLDSEFHA